MILRPLILVLGVLGVALLSATGAMRVIADAPSNDACSLLASDDVARLLGYPATSADEVSRRNGSCYFYSRSASEDGTLAYRIVRDADVETVRRNFTAARITCGGVAPQAPRFAECAAYRKLAEISSPKDYCVARTDLPDAEPLSEGAFSATFVSGSLFSLREGVCFEARVLHGDQPQRDSEIALLKLLLERSSR